MKVIRYAACAIIMFASIASRAETMNVFRRLVKSVGTPAVSGAAVARPAIGEESLESRVRLRFAENVSSGVVKGFELQGKVVSEDDKQYIYTRSLETADKIIPLVRKAGLLDDYAENIFDPEISAIDEKILKAADMQEVEELLKRQIAIMSSKYPELYAWVTTSTEAIEIMDEFMVELAMRVGLKNARK